MSAMEDFVGHLAANVLLAFADGTDSGAGSGSLVGLLLPLVVIGGLFYFMLIMPQRRRIRQAEAMRGAVSVGDAVRTIGGIYGTVRSIDEDEIVLDVGGGTTLRILRRAIAERLGGDEG